MKDNYLELHSVGCMVDKKTLVVYPQMNDGTPDLNCGADIFKDSNIDSEEWKENLSTLDKLNVEELLKKNRFISIKQIKELIKHASELSYYLKDDEQRHFEECNEKEKQNHIYNSIKQVEDITSDLLNQIY
jgi:hypothetical protein